MHFLGALSVLPLQTSFAEKEKIALRSSILLWPHAHNIQTIPAMPSLDHLAVAASLSKSSSPINFCRSSFKHTVLIITRGLEGKEDYLLPVLVTIAVDGLL